MKNKNKKRLFSIFLAKKHLYHSTRMQFYRLYCEYLGVSRKELKKSLKRQQRKNKKDYERQLRLNK